MNSVQEYISCSKLFLLDNGIFLVCFDSNSMKNTQEVEKFYYREVGTFIDLVCQRDLSCAKIILVATKVDGRPWLPSWLQQTHSKTFAAILQKTKDHISYLCMPQSPQTPVILFDEVLATSAKNVSTKWLGYLHRVVTAMVTGVSSLPPKAIPQCWITWLQDLRKNPVVSIAELEDFQDTNDFVNLSDDEVEKLTFLKEQLESQEQDFLGNATPTRRTSDAHGQSHGGQRQPSSPGASDDNPDQD